MYLQVMTMLSQLTPLELSFDIDVKTHPDFRNIKIWKKCTLELRNMVTIKRAKFYPFSVQTRSQVLPSGSVST